jgi:hypothetical protein
MDCRCARVVCMCGVIACDVRSGHVDRCVWRRVHLDAECVDSGAA